MSFCASFLNIKEKKVHEMKPLKNLNKDELLKRAKNPMFSVGILLAIVVLWFFSGLLKSNHEEETTKADEGLFRVSVASSEAQERWVYHTVQGRTGADNNVTLRAQTNGTVEKLVAGRGTRVKKGDVLITLAIEDRVEKLEEAKALLESRRLDYEAALKLSKQSFKARNQVADSRASLEAAQSLLARTQKDLDYTKILAPFDGILNARSVDVGDNVKEGDNLATVVNLDPLIILIAISEDLITSIILGKPCEITLATQQKLEGKITYISAVADPITRTYQVEVEVQNPDYKILDGLTATVRVPLRLARVHLISPAIISLNSEGIPGVKGVDAQDIVHFYPIKMSNPKKNGIWVEGLPQTARIITVGQDFVAVGQKVEPVLDQRQKRVP